MSVRKAVIPAAGLGTRFLPVTKAVPKELLPIVDKPMLQYVVEEAVEAGIQQIIIVISPGKETLARYFHWDQQWEQFLAEKASCDLARKMRLLSSMAHISYVIQEKPLGLGHAVLTAKDQIGDEPFIVILPDDIIWHSESATAQMLRIFKEHGTSLVAVEEVPWDEVKNYGVVKPIRIGDRIFSVEGLVEKPDPSQAPSNLTIVGRYVLTPEIFSCLERTPPGAKGEIQLTDGMALLLNEQPLYAYQFHGIRYDCGTPLGILKASLEIALQREDTRKAALELLERLKSGLTTED